METGTVWGITLLVVGFLATLATTQVLLGALFPARTAATRRALRARPVVCCLAGVVTLTVAILLLVGAAAVLNKFGLDFVVAVLISIASLFVLSGLGAVAAEVGERLPSTAQAASGWRATIRGSLAVSLASLLPVAGWFIVFPLTWAAGLGAFVLGLFGVGAAAIVAPSPSRFDVPAPVAAPGAAHPAEISA